MRLPQTVVVGAITALLTGCVEIPTAPTRDASYPASVTPVAERVTIPLPCLAFVCRPPGHVTQPRLSIAGVTPDECADELSFDHDGDALEDPCEFQLAYAFRPRLAFDQAELGVGRESYWAAFPGREPNSVSVVYLLGYHRDFGHPTLGGAHDGDSEFIVVNVEWFGETWNVVGAYLSAHWGTPSDRSNFYPWWSLTYEGARPIVIVSARKHANYNSVEQCKFVFLSPRPFFEPGCGKNGWSEDVDVREYRNVGSAASHAAFANCTTSEEDPVAYPGTECLWDDAHFRGWMPAPHDGEPPTGYGVELRFAEAEWGRSGAS